MVVLAGWVTTCRYIGASDSGIAHRPVVGFGVRGPVWHNGSLVRRIRLRPPDGHTDTDAKPGPPFRADC
ncbi:hypothetical protein GTC6_05632 [Gordonia terrae C-6]|uniref:Uncharacterized protein n=1 Tax=Gordonia terrae C-6 TaxID=1316928 RepID=R7YCU9_9ACTN|nr:hypothetical protein GTC6_05632 [Gordonia terrae C-6]